jgi:hypothetical protein
MNMTEADPLDSLRRRSSEKWGRYPALVPEAAMNIRS